MSSQDCSFLLAREVFRVLVEKLINQILRADSESEKHLALLDGKLLAIKFTELPRFFLWVNKGQIQMLWETTQCPDGTIIGQLFADARGKTNVKDNLFDHGVACEVFGDPDTTRVIRIFFSQFEPDWEEQLSGIVGDTMARKAGQGLRAVTDWAHTVSNSAMQNLSEYLQEERQMLATRIRVDRHLSEIARLQSAVDALERRLTLLDCVTD
jgi:ubiquinone biosynthesis protein UbiJ